MHLWSLGREAMSLRLSRLPLRPVRPRRPSYHPQSPDESTPPPPAEEETTTATPGWWGNPDPTVIHDAPLLPANEHRLMIPAGVSKRDPGTRTPISLSTPVPVPKVLPRGKKRIYPPTLTGVRHVSHWRMSALDLNARVRNDLRRWNVGRAQRGQAAETDAEFYAARSLPVASVTALHTGDWRLAITYA
ncbi:hypothetical protein BC827DRAFT_1158125 [Russula dissimulans]|nr:hypothetical protein BC827DRAFT_1158125 [Russula dissimulans]